MGLLYLLNDSNPGQPFVSGAHAGTGRGIPVETVEGMCKAGKGTGKEAHNVTHPNTPHGFNTSTSRIAQGPRRERLLHYQSRLTIASW